MENMQKNIRREQALTYHSEGKPGKIEVVPTKEAKTQRDLSLAYSPGVAEPCKEIAANKEDAYKYTAKGNLVAVITNGTAVLGLGDIGPEASKPVMEGKGVLFKIFADIDVFDIEINEKDPTDRPACSRCFGVFVRRVARGRVYRSGERRDHQSHSVELIGAARSMISDADEAWIRGFRRGLLGFPRQLLGHLLRLGPLSDHGGDLGGRWVRRSGRLGLRAHAEPVATGVEGLAVLTEHEN